MAEIDRTNWTDDEWRQGREQTADYEEQLHGPVVGTFTVTELATTGAHPEEVREAWKGVALPVRKETEARTTDRNLVRVLCSDGFNALVGAGVDEKILQYWINLLEGNADDYTTFDFLIHDGELEPALEA